MSDKHIHEPHRIWHHLKWQDPNDNIVNDIYAEECLCSAICSHNNEKPWDGIKYWNSRDSYYESFLKCLANTISDFPDTQKQEVVKNTDRWISFGKLIE